MVTAKTSFSENEQDDIKEYEQELNNPVPLLTVGADVRATSGQVNNKFAPYGTSIFDKMVQPVKLYTLALMSSIVSRLSRAAVVRKWTIEAGDKRNHEEIVAKTTSDLKSKAITFDKINLP